METPVAIVFIFVFICMVIGSLYAFYWAARTGQLEQLREGSTSIFDEEERVGVITDAFPDGKGLPKSGVTLVRSFERE